MAKGLPEITISAVTIAKVVIAEKNDVKFSDLELDAEAANQLARFCQEKTQVDLVIRQHQGELFEN